MVLLVAPLSAVVDSTVLQGIADGLDALDTGEGSPGIWVHTGNPHQRNPLFMSSLFGIKGPRGSDNDYRTSLFFSRASSLAYGLDDMLPLRDKLGDVLYAAYFAKNPLSPSAARTWSTSMTDTLEKISFQEHNLGVTLAKNWSTERWYLSLATWVGVAERNFWLDSTDRQKVADLATQLTGPTEPFSLEEFYSLAFGISDVRLEGGATFRPLERITVSCGGVVTLPIARKPHYEAYGKVLPFDSYDAVLRFALDRMQDMLIMPALGTDGHWMVGATSKLVMQVSDAVSLRGSAECHVVIPALEKRHFLQRYTGPMFIFAETEAEQVEAIRIKARTLAFPEPLEAHISPGNITKLVVACDAVRGAWSGSVGYDYYRIAAEQPETFFDRANEDLYDKHQGVYESARSQHTLFGGFSYTKVHPRFFALYCTLKNVTAHWGVSYEQSIGASGFGPQFSFALSLRTSF